MKKWSLAGYALAATLSFSITNPAVAQDPPATTADVRPSDTEVMAGTGGGTGPSANRSPMSGIPANLAALRNYSTRRVASDDRKGNADMRRIEPGATFVAADLTGPGEITHLWTTIATPNPNHLRDTIIRIYYDGNDFPSVESPIGDFYGLGHCQYYIFDNTVQAIGSDKGMNCFWPMPFKKSAKVTITNESDKRIDAYYYYVDWRKFDTLPQNLGYFHAHYRQAFPTENGKRFVILDTDGGRGHFCGVNLSIHTQVGGWWGEGDDVFTIDGEAEPSLWGTGSEDYFCGAWCYAGTFYNNYFGMPLRSKLNQDADNYWNVYRLHVESPVTFNKSLKVEIEHGTHGFDNTRPVSNNNYASVAYWYQETPQRLKGTLPPAAERITRYTAPGQTPGVYEFQYMKRAEVAGVEAESQGMGGFTRENRKWQNEDHMWVKNLKANQALELSFETTAPVSGPAVMRVTTAKDYGQVAISLDGKPVAKYDGYTEHVQPGLINLGDLNLPAGKHTVTIVNTGKNDAASNSYWGGDYIRIGGTTPAIEAGTAELKATKQ